MPSAGLGERIWPGRVTPLLPVHRNADPVEGTALTPWIGEDAIARVRRLGISVDRRSLALRPAWRGDDAELALLARRPAGAADLTLLELRDLAVAAQQYGLGSRAHLAAADFTRTRIARARAMLRRGGADADVAVIGTGPAHQVLHHGDPTQALPAELRRGLRQGRARITPAVATWHCRSWPLAERLRAALGREEGHRLGRVLSAQDERALGLGARQATVRFAAHPGTAFAPVRAAIPWPPPAADRGFAALDWHDAPADTEWRAADVARLVVARTARSALARVAAQPALANAPAPAAIPEDLLALLARAAEPAEQPVAAADQRTPSRTSNP